MSIFLGSARAFPIVVAPSVVADLVRVREVFEAAHIHHGEPARVKAGEEFSADGRETFKAV